MIGALAVSGTILKRGADIEAARRAAEAILEKLGPVRTLSHFAKGRAARGSASLVDYAYLAEGLLDLHENTGELRWRSEAAGLADAAVARFWDPAGSFFSADAKHGPLPLRAKTAHDTEHPSANGVMAGVLLRLGRLTGEARYTRLGEKTIEAFAPEAASDPQGMETLMAAALLLDSPAIGRSSPLPPSP